MIARSSTPGMPMWDPESKSIGGIYMEDPYLNPKYGTNRHLNPWDKPVLAEDYAPTWYLQLRKGMSTLSSWAARS